MLIEKYTSDWIKNFEDLKLEIDNGLKGLKYRIEHVGSTSVPKLASKPIIDIDIIYESESEFKKIKSGLVSIGYYHNGNQGIEMREVFKRTENQTNKILDFIKHHLYVCKIGSKALDRHILLRDFLIKNESARLEYESMKYILAEKANQNQKVYAELKELNINDFIDSIIELEKLNVEKKKRTHNTVYKKLLVLAKPKLVARLLASDFPSENPRTQTRNFPYTNTLAFISKNQGENR